MLTAVHVSGERRERDFHVNYKYYIACYNCNYSTATSNSEVVLFIGGRVRRPLYRPDRQTHCTAPVIIECVSSFFVNGSV